MKPRKWNGRPIMSDGWYSGIPIERYHEQDGTPLCDGPSISSGGLKRIFNNSLAHYWHSSPYNSKREPVEQTAAMLLGRAAHHLLLGEKRFNTLYAIRPSIRPGTLVTAWNGNADACKAWLAKRAAEGRDVITPDQAECIIGMARAIRAHPFASDLLSGWIETSFVWKDKETGIWLKARPDAFPTASADFGDLKTTASILDWDLGKLIADRKFNQQGALVREACKVVLAMPMSTFSNVFVESKGPHCVRVKSIKPGELDRGQRMNRAALRMFAEAMANGKWLGPGGEQRDAEYIELPEWDQKRIDAKLEELKA